MANMRALSMSLSFDPATVPILCFRRDTSTVATDSQSAMAVLSPDLICTCVGDTRLLGEVLSHTTVTVGDV